jgi:hypothetical protein
VGAVAAEASEFPGVRFAVLGAGASGLNISQVGNSSSQRARTVVKELIEQEVHRHTDY